MFSVRNITRAALMSAALANANANGEIHSNSALASHHGKSANELIHDAVESASKEANKEVNDLNLEDIQKLITEDGQETEQGITEGVTHQFYKQLAEGGDAHMLPTFAPPEASTTTTEAPATVMPELDVPVDVPELDGMLKGVMDFEAKLFGAETDEALTALVTEMKESEQGHDEEAKAAIDMLEQYRNEEHDTSLIAKEDQDRAILIAEIFTAMVAQSPVEMVVQTIKALKASEETPKVEDLENIKAMMIDGLSKQGINSISEEDVDMPVDTPIDTPTDAPPTDAPPTDAPLVEEPEQETAAPENDEEINESGHEIDEPYEEPEVAGKTDETEVAEPEAAAILEQQAGDGESTGESTDQESEFEQYRVPLIIAAGVVGSLLVAIGAMVGIRRRNRNKVQAPAYEDFVNPVASPTFSIDSTSSSPVNGESIV